ncbi:MAG: hypothetical protein R6U98_28440 [Pirellulaceae bacterium]
MSYRAEPCLRVHARGVWTVAVMLTLTGWAMTLHATEPDRRGESPHVERSSHFVLHTDLSPARTNKLLERLEETLAEVSDYWQRPTRGRIECFVVDDLDNWPHDALPHPMARLIVDRIGGVTLVDSTGAGIRTKRKVTVLATSQQGAAEHEVVHAYCALMFGVTGPVWYREGIAQVFAYNEETQGGLHCPREMLSDLASHSPKPIAKVVKGRNISRGLCDSLVKKMKGRQNKAAFLSIDNWNQGDARELDRLKREYAWCWLACHLLYHNPNYRDRFSHWARAIWPIGGMRSTLSLVRSWTSCRLNMNSPFGVSSRGIGSICAIGSGTDAFAARGTVIHRGLESKRPEATRHRGCT